MLTGIHILLTYKCDRECEHCFVHAGPGAPGTFTLAQLDAVLEELPRIGTIETVFFEGGEPFLFYPVMREGMRRAAALGLVVGTVTNAYWATVVEDALAWLTPLQQAGLTSLVLSEDALHGGEAGDARPGHARAAAERLGVSCSTITTEHPRVEPAAAPGEAPTVSGGVMFRGRAAHTLIEGLPRSPCAEFTECPHEDLREPGRVHVDAAGYVHLCQGLSMGDMWQTPLSRLVAAYNPEAHPVCGPLLEGGPALLAETYGIEHEDAYVSACHFCYSLRRALLDRFPRYLGPPQVYGRDPT